MPNWTYLYYKIDCALYFTKGATIVIGNEPVILRPGLMTLNVDGLSQLTSLKAVSRLNPSTF
jgi:hypothetical protein